MDKIEDETERLFSSLKVSTSTNIVYFKNKISDLWTPFWLLPVRIVGKHVFDRSGRRKQLPDNMIEGRIYSLGYKGLSRGYVKSKDQFKHSLNVAISTNINIPTAKISSNNIHICGLKDVNSIKTTTSRIASHVNSVFANVKYLRDHPDKMLKAYNWFNHNCRGSECTYLEYDRYGNYVTVLDHRIILPFGMPSDLDFVASNYILRIMNECIYMGVGFMGKATLLIKKFIMGLDDIDFIVSNYTHLSNVQYTQTDIQEHDVSGNEIVLDLSYIRSVMINYNFNILKIFGCTDKIFKMYELYERIDKMTSEEVYPFIVIYDPMIGLSLKLYIVVEDDRGKYVHTITMKHTGSVIYSSSHNDTSSDVFGLFVDMMKDMLDLTIDLCCSKGVTRKSKKYHLL